MRAGARRAVSACHAGYTKVLVFSELRMTVFRLLKFLFLLLGIMQIAPSGILIDASVLSTPFGCLELIAV